MKRYIENMTKAIPSIIQLGMDDEHIGSKESLRFYGFFHFRGFKGFWYKLRIGIKQIWQQK